MKYIYTLLLFFVCYNLKAQTFIGDGSVTPTTPVSSAVVQLESKTKGLLLPVINNPSTALTVSNTPSSAVGLTVYDKSYSKSLSFYNNASKWESMRSWELNPLGLYLTTTTETLTPTSGTMYTYPQTATFTVTKKSLVEINPDDAIVSDIRTSDASNGANFIVVMEFKLTDGVGNVIQTLTTRSRSLTSFEGLIGVFPMQVWMTNVLMPGTYALQLRYGIVRGAYSLGSSNYVRVQGAGNDPKKLYNRLYITEIN